MALLLLIALAATCIFLFYYEFVWKKAGRDFLFGGNAQLSLNPSTALGVNRVEGPVVASSPWQDWKYRTLVELHRKNRLFPEEAANLAGVSSQDIERYFDELESQGKVQSAGDAERGIFYTPVSSLTNLPVSSELEQSPSAVSSGPKGHSSMQARGFE